MYFAVPFDPLLCCIFSWGYYMIMKVLFVVVLLLQIDYMLKFAWMFLSGFFMEVKVDRHSDIGGSSTFLE